VSNQQYYVYLMTNHSKTLYTGVTRDIAGRVLQHKSGHGSGFTTKYQITRLIYYEEFSDIRDAIVSSRFEGFRKDFYAQRGLPVPV
jgi:putative endonuclease